MTTLLFFDDNALGVSDNVIRGVGRPQLSPEDEWCGIFLDEHALAEERVKGEADYWPAFP